MGLGIVGVLVAVNIRGDVRLKVAERRLNAYERLWAATSVTSPYGAPLDAAGRAALHEKLTNWYYANGDGTSTANPGARQRHDPDLPAAGAPFRDRRAFGAQGGVLAVARVEPRLVR